MWSAGPRGSVSGMTTSSITRPQPSLRQRFPRRLAPAGVPLVAVACLLLSAGVSAASSDPASPDPAGCSATLARAAVWPGTFTDPNGTHRIYSDAYDTYLAHRAPCAGPQ
jgi:hypothetical protein